MTTSNERAQVSRALFIGYSASWNPLNPPYETVE